MFPPIASLGAGGNNDPKEGAGGGPPLPQPEEKAMAWSGGE